MFDDMKGLLRKIERLTKQWLKENEKKKKKQCMNYKIIYRQQKI